MEEKTTTEYIYNDDRSLFASLFGPLEKDSMEELADDLEGIVSPLARLGCDYNHIEILDTEAKEDEKIRLEVRWFNQEIKDLEEYENQGEE